MEERISRCTWEMPSSVRRLGRVGDEVHFGAASVDRGERLLDEGVVAASWDFGVGEEGSRDSRGYSEGCRSESRRR